MVSLCQQLQNVTLTDIIPVQERLNVLHLMQNLQKGTNDLDLIVAILKKVHHISSHSTNLKNWQIFKGSPGNLQFTTVQWRNQLKHCVRKHLLLILGR